MPEGRVCATGLRQSGRAAGAVGTIGRVVVQRIRGDRQRPQNRPRPAGPGTVFMAMTINRMVMRDGGDIAFHVRFPITGPSLHPIAHVLHVLQHVAAGQS